MPRIQVEPRHRGFPWWTLIALIAVLIIAGLLMWYFTQRNPEALRFGMIEQPVSLPPAPGDLSVAAQAGPPCAPAVEHAAIIAGDINAQRA